MPNPRLAGVEREDAWIPAPDGVLLHGWVLRPAAPPRGTCVFFHGNAENVSTHVNAILWLVEAGYQVVAVDYRGFGRSGGEADLAGTHADALATLAWVFQRADVDPDRVFVLGQSLGGAVAVYAVARSPHRKRVRLLIVDSAPAGYRRIAREKIARLILTWPFQHLLALGFDDRHSAERWIGKVSPVPVLLLHGGRDRIVPVRHARLLHELAPDPKGLWIVQDAGHIQALAHPPLREHLLEVLPDLLRGVVPPEAGERPSKRGAESP
ncbi:MAG: alpha/beta fold hydrolase [Thermodesulfobacteriota bacterium]